MEERLQPEGEGEQVLERYNYFVELKEGFYFKSKQCFIGKCIIDSHDYFTAKDPSYSYNQLFMAEIEVNHLIFPGDHWVIQLYDNLLRKVVKSQEF